MTNETKTRQPILYVPDSETDVDLIYFEPFAVALMDLISSAPDKPMTIGVHGDWGAGKSSVLSMMATGLGSREDILVLHFDGWRFQGFDDAKTVLLESIITALRDERRFDAKIKDELTAFLKRIKWLKVAKKAVQIGYNLVTLMPTPGQVQGLVGAGTIDSADRDEGAASAATDTSGKTHGGDDKDQLLRDEVTVAQTIHSFARDFEKLLAKTKLSKLVVLIDDLDRCLPETTIETLEAIRLFLFVKKTAFVIAADESMIEYAVRHHFPDLPASTNSTSYSRNYLEKLIQTPVRLPNLGVEEAKIYVTLLLVQSILGEDHAGFKQLIVTAREIIRQPWLTNDLDLEKVRNLDETKREELTAAYQLALQIGRPIAEGTSGNPRQIKRFINALAVREAIARARGLDAYVRRPELAKLMLAERFSPTFYSSIANAALISKTGIVTDIILLEASSAQASDKPTETKSAPPEGAVAAWIADDWLKSWGAIAPKLGAVDLRPYVFVARDRRVQFGKAVASEAVALVLAAVAGGSLAIAGADQNIRDLSQTDAEGIFNELCNKMLEASDLKKKPEEFEALCRIVSHHKSLRARFVDFLSDQKMEAVGPWIASGWRPETWEEPLRSKAKELVRSWSTGNNKPLKTVAIALLKKLESN